MDISLKLIEREGSIFQELESTQDYTGVGMRIIQQSFCNIANTLSVRKLMFLVTNYLFKFKQAHVPLQMNPSQV